MRIMNDLEEQAEEQPLKWVDLLNAYAQGIFPMADPDDQQLYWYSPDPRAIIPIDSPHFSKSLKRFARKKTFEIRFDSAFLEVMRCCALPRKDESESWINDEIIALYHQLFLNGYAHCIEAWHDGELVGGLYGVSIGSGFFAESMFSKVSNASKVCLYHLLGHLRRLGYTLFDVQFQNPHIKQFGVTEIARERYWELLGVAVDAPDKWAMDMD